MRSIHRRLLLLAGAGIVAAMAAGCNAWYDERSSDNYGSKRYENPQNTARAYQTKQQYSSVSHKVSTLSLNQTLSSEVQDINGVNSAIVMMGDQTAYVAITIDGTATGTISGNSAKETNEYGLVKGLYSPVTPTDDTDDPNKLSSGKAGYETVKHHEHITHMFKQKIAERIRSIEPSVHDVYISANRDFVNQLNMWAQESWKGNSLEPYREQFTQLASTIFGTEPTIPNQAEGNGR